MKTLVTRYYYSLADLSEQEGPGNLSSVTTFDALLREINPIWAVGSQTTTEQTLFQDYLWPEYYDSPIFYYDVESNPWEEVEEPELTDVVNAAKPLLGRLHRWYVESSERYLFLIAQLESIKSGLLGPVSITTSGSSSYSGSASSSGSNTGTVAVAGTNGSTTTVDVDSTISESGTNTGTVAVVGINSSTTTTDSTNTRLESDTPQNGGEDVFDTGYVSRAAKEVVDSSVAVSGTDNTTTTNNLANTSTSSTDGTTTTTVSGTNGNTTTNNLTNTATSKNEGEAAESTTVNNDVETPIERFNEVQQKLRNLYADWANEFSYFVLQCAEQEERR